MKENPLFPLKFQLPNFYPSGLYRTIACWPLTLAAYCCSWCLFSLGGGHRLNECYVPSCTKHAFQLLKWGTVKQETGSREALFTNGKIVRRWLFIEGFQNTFTIMRNETQGLLHCWRKKISCAWSPFQLIILSLFCLFKEKRKSNTDLPLCCLQKLEKLNI